MSLQSYLAPLTTVDIPQLEKLEEKTHLNFWGFDNYRKFLEDYPEYFGRKVVVHEGEIGNRMAGFLLARTLFENLEILKLGVAPEFHRMRLGSRLMEAAYREGIR